MTQIFSEKPKSAPPSRCTNPNEAPMMGPMKKLITLISISLLMTLTGCTKQVVKNRALALSIEKFDDDAQAESKTQFVDVEQQKVFVDFVKTNTTIEVGNVELQGDNDATAKLTIKTFSKSIIPQLKEVSGKEWKAKIAAAMETKVYDLKLKKIDGGWKIMEQKEVAP